MNEFERLQRNAINVKNEYPVGTRIQLEEMIDIYSPVKSGTRGTVRFVDSIGQIHMQWDDGRSLALIPETDSFRKLTGNYLEKLLKRRWLNDKRLEIYGKSRKMLRKLVYKLIIIIDFFA